MIEKLEVAHYSRETGDYATESFDSPDWETILAELQTMDRYEKPILDLLQHADDPGRDMMQITGADDIFFIDVADTDFHWSHAFDPSGSDEWVDVWTSDQGLACERKFTWPFDTASRIIKHYFLTAERHPDFHWE